MITILYIEDSPLERKFMEKFLQTRYAVVTATNGLEAIQKSKDLKPDLVLTDINMPGLDGYEVATKMKAVWPDIPVVALTGNNTEEARHMALIAGCDGWLTKPITPRQLIKALEKYLAGYVETLPETPEVAQEKLVYQQRLVNHLETQVLALTQSNNQLTAIQQITQTITESIKLDEIIDSALGNLFNLGLNYIALFLYNALDNTLTLSGQKNFSLDYLNQLVQSYYEDPSSSVIVEAIRQHKPQFLTNFASYPFPEVPLLITQSPQITCLVSLPLTVKDKTVGILHVGTEKSPSFIEAQLGGLELIGRQLAIAIDKAQMYADLQSAYEELQQLDDLKDQFIMIASHELRTPLTLVMGYTTLLQKGAGEMEQEILNIIATQTDVLDTLLGRILDLERLQHKDFLAEFVEVDLSEIVWSIVNNLTPLAVDKELTLIFESPTPSPVWLDPLKFEAILTNLIANAIQFTPSGGQVEVATTTRSNMFEVSVKDNGVGIPKSEHKRIFDKFYQIENPLTRSHGGVGLGLAIAHDMAILCGGTIYLESEPNQGSTFTYCQPIEMES